MGRRKVSATLVHAGNPMRGRSRRPTATWTAPKRAAAASRAIAFDEVDTLLDAAAERMGLCTRPSGMRVLWLSSSRDHALLEGHRVAASECDILPGFPLAIGSTTPIPGQEALRSHAQRLSRGRSHMLLRRVAAAAAAMTAKVEAARTAQYALPTRKALCP